MIKSLESGNNGIEKSEELMVCFENFLVIFCIVVVGVVCLNLKQSLVCLGRKMTPCLCVLMFSLLKIKLRPWKIFLKRKVENFLDCNLNKFSYEKKVTGRTKFDN